MWPSNDDLHSNISKIADDLLRQHQPNFEPTDSEFDGIETVRYFDDQGNVVTVNVETEDVRYISSEEIDAER